MCSLATIIDFVIMGYFWIVFISAILSWFNPDPRHPIVRLIYKLTDPAFQIVRKYIPANTVRMDFSPMVVGFILLIIRYALVAVFNSLWQC